MHPALNPHRVGVRESRDSAEHPASLAIAVPSDATGSMGAVPRKLQAKLPQRLGLLLRKGYAPTAWYSASDRRRRPRFSLEGVGGATAVLDRDPALLGERLDPGRAAELAVTRVLHAAEGGHGLIGDALVVDVDDP